MFPTGAVSMDTRCEPNDGPSPATLIMLMATVALTAAVGCQGSSSGSSAQAQQPDVAPARVNLPSPPPDKAFDIPIKNPDGTLRVEGVIANQAKFLDNKVEIKGVLTWMTEPCDPRKAESRGETCPKPHLMIRDKQDARKKLLIVGFSDDFVDRADLKTGESYTFAGTYKKVARGFVASGDGLVDLTRVDDTPVTEEK
jgi:hypothetical protein